MDSDGEDEKGLLWKLPMVKLKGVGRLGPGFGFGGGCGVGFGVGLVGGVGLGAGIPGLQFGFGIGAGCGIGVGFGYGAGRGVAYDENQKYSNLGKFFQGTENLPTPDEISALMNEIVAGTKRLIKGFQCLFASNRIQFHRKPCDIPPELWPLLCKYVPNIN